MSFADLKKQARGAVHDTLRVSALYEDSTLADPVIVYVRHHTKIKVRGDLDSEYAGVIEGVNRLVFRDSELAVGGDPANPTNTPLVLRRLGRVTIPAYGTKFELDQREPDDGPVNVYWSVVQVPLL